MRLKNVEDVYTLAPIQQGILFHMLYAPQSEVYFSQFICTIDQPLDVEAFRLAWQQVLVRHAALRAAFLWEGLDEPLQIVSGHVELPWEQLDWRGLPVAEQGARLEAFLAADRARGFDITIAPLLRLYLIQTAEHTYTFISSSPHLLIDGWSRALVLKEVSAYYEALLRGQTLRLPHVRPYRDYIGWLQHHDPAVAENYWRRELKGFTTPTTLVTAKTPGNEQKPVYASCERRLSAELTAALQRLSRQQQLTLNTLLQGAWAILLSRYSGEQDIVFGVTVAGRPASLPGSETMVGLFINTLPLRVDVQPGTPLIPWLKRLQEQQAIMLEYQHAPLVQIQSWSEIPRERQLFESILVFENTLSAVSWESANELQFRDMRGGVEETNYPLTLIVGPENELLLRVLHDTNLFEPETIAEMLGHLRNVLASMVATPAERLSDLSMLSADEQRLLLHDWNQTQRAYPAEQCIHTLFEQQVLRSPDAVALIFEEQVLTYQELNVRANQLAQHLRLRGTGPEMHIAICMEPCLELIVGLLGILKAGGVYVPLDPDYPAGRLAFMLKDAQVTLLITQQQLLDLFPEPDAAIICMDVVADQLSQHSPANLLTSTNSQNLAYIMYTSGSTGWPKGVEIRHQSIARLLYGVDYVQLDSKRTLLQLSPVAFDASTFEIWGALLHGGRCVLYPERVPTTLGIGTAVRTQGVNTLWLTASLFNVVIQEEPGVLRGLAQLLIGGEALSVPHVRLGLEHLPTTQIINGYGPTESTTFTCCYHIAASLSESTHSIPIGRPIANTQVYVLDQHLHPVPIGVAGTLYIGGAGLARGYLNHPELTAERFVPDPFSGQAGTRLYCTGDRVRYAADGNIEFLGRIDQQVKLRGFRIEPGEIEGVLLRHPEVREAAVMVFGESPADKQLVAYVVPLPGYAPSPEQLRLILESQLPAYMLPSTFVLLERFPLNPNGKLDLRALPVPDVTAAKQDAVSVAARNPIEELLMAQWVEMLGVEQIGIHDNFFELGGHSLLATQAVSRLYKTFHIELPLRTFFEAATISAIARYITSMTAKELQAPDLMPVPRPAELPLSFAQQRLWFLHQLEPANALYNIRAALSLQGNFHAEAFERSLQEIVQRHESLRTTFSAVDGLPRQLIAATLTLPLPVADLQTLTTAEQQLEVQRQALQEAETPFDLARGPLLRVTLLRLAPQEQILLLTIHHIVFDEWSLEVFGQELSKLYIAYVQGEPSPLPDLPIQYADFLLWQREWLQGQALQAHVDYWQEQLRDAPAVLPLPTDRPRPARQTFHGGTISFNLAPELSQALRALSLREGSTLFMTLLAAFTILLARYSGQEDIVVGSPIANRTRVEMENLIGFFVNTLVFRTDISGNPTFQDILHRVREVALEAYAHQNLPFEKLVEEISPERDLSRNPLFQVMFVLQHISESVFDLADLKLRPIPVEVRTTQFDLTLSLLDGAQGMEGRFSYNSDLFDASTIARMADHFQALLQGIVISPAQPIGTLPLLTAAERQQLLGGWNTTQADYPQEMCIHELFEAQMERSIDAIAIVCEEQHVTYGELNRRANQLAHHLRKRGIGPEQPVGLCVERSPELVIGILAILKAGAAYVPLDPTYPAERLAFMLHDAQIPVLLTSQKCHNRLRLKSGQVIFLDYSQQHLATEPVNNLSIQLHPSNLVYVIYTSGSTGQPKGVCVSHRNLVHSTHARMTYYQEPVASFLLLSSFAFDSSIAGLFWTLCQGGRLVLPPEHLQQDMLSLTGIAAQQGISHLLTVPSFYTLLLEQMKSGLLAASQAGRRRPCLQENVEAGSAPTMFTPLETLRTAIVAGESCPEELVEQHYQLLPHTSLFNEYGPTEGTVWSSVYPCQHHESGTRVSIGHPIANVQMYLLDKHEQPMPVDIPGELFIGGPGVARGYLNHPELTAERFIPHPFTDIPGARLYKTGDLARYLPDGRLEFLGRTDSQVKIRGYRIEPGEIEATLTRHMLIHEAVVQAREDARGDLSLVAYVVPHEGHKPAQTELRSFMQSKLPGYMIPPVFVYLDKLPLTPHGKVDRRALPAPVDREVETTGEAAPARTPIEEMLTGLWSELLSLKCTGIHDNFFELGGHSLLAIQVISRIRSLLLVEIPVRTLFEFPTVAGLARQIEQALRGEPRIESPALVSVARPQDLPLSFAQQRLWFLEQLQPGNTAYNIPLAFSIRGMLNKQALEQSIEHIVQRHEILRTTFHTQRGRPVQIIAPAATMYLPLIDLSSLSPERREAEVHRLASQEAQEPFDLTRGPLLRVTLLRLCRDEQVLLLSMHHIVSDEWSVEVFLGELNALYQAFSPGEASPLPELPFQYADYALWQRRMLPGDALRNQLDYWREQLRGMPAALNLPTDYPRPALQTFRGVSYTVKLPVELSEALKTLSLRQGVTLFMTLLAAFQVLLTRYCGQDDIVVGSPIANRTHLELEGLIGFFVNTLVLRTDLSGNSSFEEVLEGVRESALGAYTHQDIPFEQLVDLLQPERDLSRNPLFQVLFVLQQATRSPLRLADLTLDALPTEIEKTKFDLALTLVEDSEGIEGSFSYNSDLFEASTIARMAAHFQVLLQGIVTDPGQPIDTLPLLTEAEQQQQLVIWNATQTDYPRDLCLHELVEAQVARSPDCIAVVFEDHHLSYDCLNEHANQFAHHLQHLGVGPELRVGVCLERSLELVVSLLAILKAGGAYVPLEPTYPPERLRWLLHDGQMTALITQRTWLALLAPLSTPVLCLDQHDWLEWDEQRRHNPCNGVGAQNQAYVIYTSGSTGQPKGVINTHQGICNRLLWMQDCYGLTPADRVLQKTPFSFDVSVWEFFWPLLRGACLVVARPEGHRDSAYLLQLIEREQITTLHFVPSMLSALLEELGWERCQSLRHVICSGEELSSSVQQRFFARCQAELSNLYGPTEAAIDVTFWRCRRDDERPLVPIGRPIANLEVYILDYHLQPAPVGVAGELYLGGIGLARGYLGRPELTAERFIPHPWGQEPGTRLYRTGDQACYLPDGTIRFLGRRDSQVKIRGFRIEPGEVEAMLAGHAQVREIAVVARDDMPGGRGMVAYVVPFEEEAFSSQNLRAYAQERLPEYMVPAAFVKMTTLPTTANGKLDHQRLPLPAWTGLNQASAEPVTEHEKLLARIWGEVLGIEGVGIHTNFFDVGGDSILSMLIIARAHEAGLHLTPKQIFQHQTIAGLAAIAQTSDITCPPDRVGKSTSAHDAERELGFVPLLPMQHWFFAQHFPEPQHWNQAVCLEIPSPRIVPALLQQAIIALVERHGALRLRFTHDTGSWKQSIAQTETLTASLLNVLDVSQLSPTEQEPVFAEAANQLQTSLNLEVGPLLRALYVIRGSSRPGLLVIGIHHLAVDVVSWRILLEELRTIFSQLERGMPVQLPVQTASFKRWCEFLHSYANSPEHLQEASYWLAYERQDAPPLPLDFAAGLEANTEASQDHISLSLNFGETRELLQDVPGVYHTQINEVLLTALLLTCAPWLGQYRLLVNLEGHGREGLFDTIDTSRTVGWFTSIFPVLLDLTHLASSPLSRIDLGQALKTIKEEVRAVPRHGIGYGVLRYMGDSTIGARLAELPQAQMSFNYVGQFADVQGDELFRPVQTDIGPLRSRQGRRSHVLDVSGVVADGRFQINWSFSRNLHRRETIEMLARRYLEMLQALIAHCHISGAGGYTPSDFPELGLSQARLDKVLSRLRSPGKKE